MSDLVERLRGPHGFQPECYALRSEAADEIERLQADLAAMRGLYDRQRNQCIDRDCEIEKLRAALANERELCAQVCDEMAARGWNKDYGAAEGMKWCAEAIRALTD